MTTRVLAAVLLAAAALVASCTPETQRVELSELAAQQASYDGTRVEVVGTVRMHDSPLHYWVEDDAQNRVELVPGEVAEPHVGDTVRVVGRFSYADDRGRVIDVEEISRAGRP